MISEFVSFRQQFLGKRQVIFITQSFPSFSTVSPSFATRTVLTSRFDLTEWMIQRGHALVVFSRRYLPCTTPITTNATIPCMIARAWPTQALSANRGIGRRLSRRPQSPQPGAGHAVGQGRAGDRVRAGGEKLRGVVGNQPIMRKAAATRAAENGATGAGAGGHLRLVRGADGDALHQKREPRAGLRRGPSAS